MKLLTQQMRNSLCLLPSASSMHGDVIPDVSNDGRLVVTVEPVAGDNESLCCNSDNLDARAVMAAAFQQVPILSPKSHAQQALLTCMPARSLVLVQVQGQACKETAAAAARAC